MQNNPCPECGFTNRHSSICRLNVEGAETPFTGNPAGMIIHSHQKRIKELQDEISRIHGGVEFKITESLSDFKNKISLSKNPWSSPAISRESEGTEFTKSLSRILDLCQLLKYNLDDFKSMDIHKEILDNRKNMRSDCASLFTAINNFINQMRVKNTPQVFRDTMQYMERDHLHDISLHMDIVYRVKNITAFTKILEAAREQIIEDNGKEETGRGSI